MFLKDTKSKLTISLLNIFTSFTKYVTLKLLNYPTKFNQIVFFKSFLFTCLNKIFFVIDYKRISTKRALRDFPVSKRGSIFDHPLFIGDEKSNFYMRIYKDTRKSYIANKIANIILDKLLFNDKSIN